jgi:FHS family L-fucose permease-like MFS transporter
VLAGATDARGDEHVQIGSSMLAALAYRSPVLPAAQPNERRLLALVMCLFFAFGFCTVLVDTLIPKLKAMFSLDYTEVMLTQFCFFGAYFVVSLPAGWIINRAGYLRGMTLGLVVMAVGALLFTPAARLGIYPGFLCALFILAGGVTIVQVAANPLTARIGDPAQASSRLTLAQAFNSLATMIGPIVGATLILSHVRAPSDLTRTSPAALAAFRVHDASVFQWPFLGIAAVLLLLAAICWGVRGWAPAPVARRRGSYRRVLASRPLRLGALAIFAYVGAEVAIGSSMANFLMQPDVLGLDAHSAGRLVSVYWGLAMLGRFFGTVLLRRAPPPALLAGCAAAALLLALLAGATQGVVAACCLLSIGLFNAIMFPTIFTLSLADAGEDAGEASGILCLAIVGGAIVPLLTGLAADRVGLGAALSVPAACYAWIGLFGIYILRRTPVNSFQANF